MDQQLPEIKLRPVWLLFLVAFSFITRFLVLFIRDWLFTADLVAEVTNSESFLVGHTHKQKDMRDFEHWWETLNIGGIIWKKKHLHSPSPVTCVLLDLVINL